MPKTLSLSQAFREGLREEMLRDASIFVLGTDLLRRGGHWGQVKGLGEEFGADRIRDTPISEAAMVAAGVGAALGGMHPVVDLNFIDFVFGAMDEVVNQAAKIRYMFGVGIPLVIRAQTGVALGAAQHNNSIEAWFSHTPGLIVAMPSNPYDTKGLIKAALRGADPVIFLMHKTLATVKGDVGDVDTVVPLGSASTPRPGSDCTVVAYSVMVHKAMSAAENLAARHGIDTEVIDLRTVAPIDYPTIERSVQKTGRLVVLTEAPLQCSVATEVAARVQASSFDYLHAPIGLLGAAHSPIPHSPALIPALIPQVSDIESAVLTAVERR